MRTRRAPGTRRQSPPGAARLRRPSARPGTCSAPAVELVQQPDQVVGPDSAEDSGEADSEDDVALQDRGAHSRYVSLSAEVRLVGVAAAARAPVRPRACMLGPSEPHTVSPFCEHGLGLVEPGEELVERSVRGVPDAEHGCECPIAFVASLQFDQQGSRLLEPHVVPFLDQDVHEVGDHTPAVAAVLKERQRPAQQVSSRV